MKKNDNKKNVPLLFPLGTQMRPDLGIIAVDRMGSYTGVTEDPTDTPVQDADDL